MTVPDIPHAPGCFGSALTYKAGTTECDTCEFAEKCAPISARRLAVLREKYNVAEPKKARERRKPEPAEPLVLPPEVPPDLTLPLKVQGVLARIERAGVKVTEALRRGENPFQHNWLRFLYVACAVLLLRQERGATREEVIDAFQKKMKWSEATAAAHFAQAVHALRALGAADLVNGRLQLRNQA